MQLGVALGVWGARARLDIDMVKRAEELGYRSVWAAEAWGTDAVTVLAWIGARTKHIMLGSSILQMPARTPAMTAMTAVTLNELSGGRFLLGLGLSGPQVVEGWHGRPYGKPLGKTREYLDIVRTIVARETPLVHDGAHYQIPYRGPDASGLGKPLKLITHPTADIPIYLAAIGPRNVELSAEIGDGWLPVFFSPEKAGGVFGEALERGFAASQRPDAARNFDIAPMVTAVIGEDVTTARAAVKPGLALYIGGMGAKGRNFYFDLACRYGYAEAAEQVQELYLGGNRLAAAKAVPDDLVDEVAIVGTRSMVAERLVAWRDAGVTTLIVSAPDPDTMETLADLVA
ncbi:MAG: LLM class F420-dependent oxidoreductase [Acidimicrobiia bacterium]